jgi:hypothetical protein
LFLQDPNEEEANLEASSADSPVHDDLIACQDLQGQIIVDMLSLERNFVLVNANLIGGPSEKRLPPRNTDTDQNENFRSAPHAYTFPLFDTLPVPDYYLRTTQAPPPNADTKDLLEIIEKYSTIGKSEDSLNKYLKAFRSCFVSTIQKGRVEGELLSLLMTRFVEVLQRVDQGRLIGAAEFGSFNEFIAKSAGMAAEEGPFGALQMLGVKKTVQYGLQTRQLQKAGREESEAGLVDVMKVARVLLKAANKNPKKSQKSSSVLSKFISLLTVHRNNFFFRHLFIGCSF